MANFGKISLIKKKQFILFAVWNRRTIHEKMKEEVEIIIGKAKETQSNVTVDVREIAASVVVLDKVVDFDVFRTHFCHLFK